jgi:hypothetical protein
MKLKMKTLKIVLVICFLQINITNIFCQNPDEEQFVKSSICEKNGPVRDVAFERIGRYRGFTENGAEYQKTYLASRYAIANWFEAKAICKSFDLELASFETLAEANFFLNLCYDNDFIQSYGLTHIHIDGMTQTPNSTTEWYWTNSGKKISFSIPWHPGQPDFFGDEYCFSFMASPLANVLGFNDMRCNDYIAPFVCQRIDFSIPVRLN